MHVARQLIPLTLLPRAISDLTGEPAPSYREIWNAAVDGRIPVQRQMNGRWYAAPIDVPRIAQVMSKPGCTGAARVGTAADPESSPQPEEARATAVIG
jgi:hypothetical protein